MKTIAATVFSCALLALPSLAQTGSASHGSNAMAAAMSPQEFVNMAAQDDMTEANLGQLAQDNSSSDAVKDYGKMLRSNHTENYDKLTAVATKANLTVPKGIDPMHQKMIAPLEKLKGASFDRMFDRTMITSHQKAIAMFTKEADDTQNPALADFAKTTLPVLQEHLQAAQNLMKQKK